MFNRVAQPSEARHVVFRRYSQHSPPVLSYHSNLWPSQNQLHDSFHHNSSQKMNVTSDIANMVDKVGLVPGLSIAVKLVMQIWQTVQVCHVRNCHHWCNHWRLTSFVLGRHWNEIKLGSYTWLVWSPSLLIRLRKTWETNRSMLPLTSTVKLVNSKRMQFISSYNSTIGMKFPFRLSDSWKRFLRPWNGTPLHGTSRLCSMHPIVILKSPCWRDGC